MLSGPELSVFYFFGPFYYDLISSALKSSDGTLFSYDIKRLEWWVTLDHQEPLRVGPLMWGFAEDKA